MSQEGVCTGYAAVPGCPGPGGESGVLFRVSRPLLPARWAAENWLEAAF